MKFLNLVGNSFGCSATGERLISAARDGDVQEARDLLEYNPHLAKYSTFGARNSPLHYSAAQGHHEIVSLLLECGVDVDLKNYRGQTAMMQACQHGHWEVVQTLILFRANIHKMDYLNGGTALHLAALNGHTRCIRLLLADYIPSIPNFWDTLRRSSNEDTISEFDECALYRIINQPSDGGITALHMAALNGHVETVHLLLDLGASVTEITIGDGTTIDLIGSGSTPLHYAACGGNAQCCQLLIARGASLKAKNANGWTPLMIARSWRRDGLEEILGVQPKEQLQITPSPYLCLPLMSIVKIARECGTGNKESCQACSDPCVVCLERKCTVATEGCNHEFCTWCALYLCSTNSARTRGNAPPGSIACPLCRHGIVSFLKLPGTQPSIQDAFKMSLPLFLFPCINEGPETTSMKTPFCSAAGSSLAKSSFRLLGSRRFSSSFKFSPGLCMGDSDVCSSLVDKASGEGESQRDLVSGSKPGYRRATSQKERKRSWFCSLNQCVATGRR